MKNIKNIILTAILGLLLFAGCDDGFEEINTNPNDATVVPSGSLIADVARNAGNILYSSFVGLDMGSCWSQQIAKVNYEEEERFIVRASVIEGTVWQGIYEDVIADAKSMEDIAISEGNDYTRGAAIVLQAYGYHVLTDIFGMIPFSEAMDPSNLKPKYDTQEEVYAGILSMLDTADLLLSTGSGSLNAATDLVYGGSHTGWLKFANSLKFRALMRISGVQSVGTQLQDIVDNRSIFTSNADNANLVYLDADPNANPIYESIVYRSRFEYKVNEVMVNMLVAYSDPRLPLYATENSDGEYRGKPSGIDAVPNADWNYDNVSPVGDFYINPNLPADFMTYSELSFLMAEAAEKGLITGSAATYYYQGIKAAFDVNGLPASDYDAYILGTGVVYTTTNPLEQIGEQNWLGMYCQGVESWIEWKRTGFPVLLLPIEADTDAIPSRYNYPPIEQAINAASYSAAVAAQGADLLTTDIWWMQ
ncbi:MAG: SusD/RagB family nutrient-binding outer membrane lipoprotein [Bacteroidales bacterium]|jgi:hypothetical protein|nr:SusD/RagB family nutrient-binding outer membrane lipoprotein [Bacteroidales bacterium]